MGTVTITRIDRVDSSKSLRVAWGFLWRGLFAAACSTVGGLLVGVALGFAVALNEVIFHFTSWHELFAHYSSMLCDLFTALPI